MELLKGNIGRFHYNCYFFIGFIGVTLVIKIIQASGVQFHNTPSVHLIVCSPPQGKSVSITIYPPVPSSASPIPPGSDHRHTVVHVHEFFLFKFFSLFLYYPTQLPNLNSCQPAP